MSTESTTPFCPSAFIGQFGPYYWYAGEACGCGSGTAADSRPHAIPQYCPDCADPILLTGSCSSSGGSSRSTSFAAAIVPEWHVAGICDDADRRGAFGSTDGLFLAGTFRLKKKFLVRYEDPQHGLRLAQIWLVSLRDPYAVTRRYFTTGMDVQQVPWPVLEEAVYCRDLSSKGCAVLEVTVVLRGQRLRWLVHVHRRK
jgi:hypothetical protein